LRAAAEAKNKLKTLSAERVAKELLRLLEAGNPAPVLRVMAATGILSELLPDALQLPRLERLAELDADHSLPRDGVLRLAALLPDGGEAAHAAADALKLSNADRTRLEQALSGEKIAAQLSAQDARRLLYRIGVARFKDKVLLQWAGASAARPGAWRMLLEMADNWQRPRFPLTGRDVMQAGVPEGPDVGRLLAQVEDWWMGRDFIVDEGSLRDRLKAVIDQDRR
jgi:poly(A) polymerase